MNYTVDSTQPHPQIKGIYRLRKDGAEIGWIGENAKIGENAWIGKDAWIGEDAIIGLGAVIGKNAVIGKGAMIGDGATIGPYAVIGWGTQIGKCAWINNGTWINEEAMIGDDAMIYEAAVIGACARIGAGAVIKYPYDYLTVGAIGSRQDVTTFYRHQDGMIHVWCGCFNGTLDDFEAKVHKTHAGTIHERAYMAAIRMAREIMSHD